jgi:hypothetical protein
MPRTVYLVYLGTIIATSVAVAMVVFALYLVSKVIL